MKKFTIAFTLLSTAAFAGSWSGTISDSNCGAKHADASDKSMACVKRCMERGATPVFVTGDKVLKISNPDAVKEVVGQKVQLTGELVGDTVTVEKVSPDTK
ncbi:MAG: hypothetical protein JO022_13160 [Acidobacteriaceae bacterium]|nr:hypothetical protein [Acidobacteriaceae bacterium]